MTDDAAKHAEATKKKLTEDREARQKAQSERAATQVKPTPTQEENDLAASGVPVPEHEDDGSGPDPNQTRHVEADKNRPSRAAYQTRAHTAS